MNPYVRFTPTAFRVGVLMSTIGAQRVTLATEVKSEIQRRILRGEIDAGQKLNEAQLAAAMSVSRGTVREAVRMLADSGLIQIITNRGAFVRQVTVEEIRDLYNLRGAIFSMACGLLAGRMAQERDEELLEKLEKNIEKMRAAQAEDRRDRYYDLNIEFHEALMEGARNRRAKNVYDGLVKEMHLFRRRGLSRSMNIARSLDEHLAIYDAIRSGDVQGARDAGLAHTQGGLQRFESVMGEEPGDDITPVGFDRVPL